MPLSYLEIRPFYFLSYLPEKINMKGGNVTAIYLKIGKKFRSREGHYVASFFENIYYQT